MHTSFMSCPFLHLKVYMRNVFDGMRSPLTFLVDEVDALNDNDGLGNHFSYLLIWTHPRRGTRGSFECRLWRYDAR